MATARTTGADAQAEELRRRNVAGQTAAPVVNQTQIKEKSKDKVRALAKSQAAIECLN